jgi:VanZ family protein
MRRFLQKILAFRFCAVVWTIIIFILLAMPGNMLPNENKLSIPNLDKYVHIILFGTFVFLWSMYFTLNKNGNVSKKNIITIFVIACLYGIAMEYVQKYFIPNRDFDVYDMLADAVGAFGGFLVFSLMIPWLKTPQ